MTYQNTEQQSQDCLRFKNTRISRDECLGTGAYGAVYKAKCDELTCAAKILHPTLFDPSASFLVASHRQHRLPMRRFCDECGFLRVIRHPNIVQYLGMYEDPVTLLPVLLMELMDESLTKFLERSTRNAIPYHVQVNICHDITLALSFLHSNKIIHRDLSSNNILLIGNVRAKVSDLGMARLGLNSPTSNTCCPGADVYMPPEAVQSVPVYSEKIDCFSFGVIVLQILTHKFPDPSDRQKVISTDDPRFPRGLKADVPEVERRKNHIDKVDADHPLLKVVCECLTDTEDARPSAKELCERLVTLKESPKYKNCVRISQETEHELKEEHAREIQSLRQNYDLQLAEKCTTILAKDQEIKYLKEQLKESEEVVAQFVKRINDLEARLNHIISEQQRNVSKVEEVKAVHVCASPQFKKRQSEPLQEKTNLRPQIREPKID